MSVGFLIDLAVQRGRKRKGRLMLEDVRANLQALRLLADDLAPGEVTEVTAREIRILAQMIVVLTEGLGGVIDELERLSSPG